MDFSQLGGLGWMAAIAAITTATAAAWRYASSIWQSISKYAIDEIQFFCRLEQQAAALWLYRNTTPTPLSPLYVRGWSVRLKGSSRPQRVLAYSLTDGLFRSPLRWYRRWWPIWAKVYPRSDHELGSLRFIRGCLDPEATVRQMVAEYEAMVHQETSELEKNLGRHRVETFRMADRQPYQLAPSGDGGATPSGHNAAKVSSDVGESFIEILDANTCRFLNCNSDDIIRGADPRNGTLSQVALPPGGEDLPKELRTWLQRENWYASRQIPWRRGWLFYGRPGTGKTKFIRAVAAEADLPLFLVDLNGLNNTDLDRMWQKVVGQAPCIAVFEDIDTVFKGRENRSVSSDRGDVYSRTSHVTFDALLQCLDGINPSHGVLTVITTNHPEDIDSALAEFDPTTNKVRCRPGRIDRAVYFGNLTAAGKRLIIDRILPDWSEEERQKVAADAGEVTGAEMQEICTTLALERQEQEGVFVKGSQEEGPAPACGDLRTPEELKLIEERDRRDQEAKRKRAELQSLWTPQVRKYASAEEAEQDGWSTERIPGPGRRWMWVPDDARFRVFVEGREDFCSNHAYELPPALQLKYDPEFGDDKLCECGHPYGRHFDSHEDMSPAGCKYCPCSMFKESASSASAKDRNDGAAQGQDDPRLCHVPVPEAEPRQAPSGQVVLDRQHPEALERSPDRQRPRDDLPFV